MLPNLLVEPADSFGIVCVDVGTGPQRHSKSEVIRVLESNGLKGLAEDVRSGKMVDVQLRQELFDKLKDAFEHRALSSAELFYLSEHGPLHRTSESGHG